MTVRVSIMVCTASLLVAYPVMAQANRHGHGHHGNGSDHSGHNGSDHSGGFVNGVLDRIARSLRPAEFE